MHLTEQAHKFTQQPSAQKQVKWQQIVDAVPLGRRVIWVEQVESENTSLNQPVNSALIRGVVVADGMLV